MADFTGVALTVSESEAALEGMQPFFRLQNRAKIQSSIYYEGSSALRIKEGGIHDIWYGCDAGAKTIYVRVKPQVASKTYMKIIDPDTQIVMASAASSGSVAWEQISAAFTALKKVYIVRLMNPCAYDDAEQIAYFDNLE